MTTFIKAKLSKLVDLTNIDNQIKYCRISDYVKIILCNNANNQQVQNERTDFLVTIIEFLRFLTSC